MRRKWKLTLLLALCMVLSACSGETDMTPEQRELPEQIADSSMQDFTADESMEAEPESEAVSEEGADREADSAAEGDVSEEKPIQKHFVASIDELEDYSGCWYQNRNLEDGFFEANWLKLTTAGEAQLLVYSSELLDTKVHYEGNWIVDESGAVVIGMALCDGEENVEGAQANFIWGRYQAEGGDATLDMKWLEGDEIWQGIREEPVTWRRTESRFGYMQLGEYSENKNMMVFLINEVDLVDRDDTELIREYGLTEDLDGCDYMIMDESEECDIVKGFQDDCTFSLLNWEEGNADSRYTDWRHFCKALLKDLKKEKGPRFVEYTVDADGFLVSATEIYLP